MKDRPYNQLMKNHGSKGQPISHRDSKVPSVKKACYMESMGTRLVKKARYMGSIRTCLSHEETSFGVKKDLHVT
jgi:hypothetical protein